ncbi:hypothetical protein SARC_09395 [Sphaeroforma arctica JP610]|uniref:Uncharacterized protein n=1 Tax=Sphaeroforma arctica JP610 TaxID=667725 RepID=A0A0L0FN26_9EUKA|nr:hypothetical protein SARC_09395 [Sphaeroforma arctica JP610]KNC78167.1 hypothetical protein SARC_09395 [Sphaeroforma arctica JP610]|eukprot:XP_014152069.1 hypothetical protein SARC_09395 [Sphaeroforma arctica JP610]
MVLKVQLNFGSRFGPDFQKKPPVVIEGAEGGDEYFSTIRANIEDTDGNPAALLATRNKSTDDLRRVKPPALRSIDQSELRPRPFAAKVSQKFTEAFANDVYIYSIRDKETFKNGTLGYYNALKNNVLDTRGRPEELLATRNKSADFKRSDDNAELFLIKYAIIDRQEWNSMAFQTKISKAYYDAFSGDTCIYSIRDKRIVPYLTDEYYEAITNNIDDTRGRPEELLATRINCTGSVPQSVMSVKPPTPRVVDDTPESVDLDDNIETFLTHYKSIDRTESEMRKFVSKVSRAFTVAFADDACIYSIHNKRTVKNYTYDYYTALKANIENTRGRPEVLLATRKCKYDTKPIGAQDRDEFLNRYHTSERDSQSTREFISKVFKLFTDMLTNDTCIYSIHDRKCIQKRSSKYKNTIKFNIEATRGRPEVLLETRNTCTESCSDDKEKPRPTIKYQLTDRNSVVTRSPLWETVYYPFVEKYNQILDTSNDFVVDIARLYQRTFQYDKHYYNVSTNKCKLLDIKNLEENIRLTMGRPFDLLEYRILCRKDPRLSKKWTMELERHALPKGGMLCMPKYFMDDDATVFDNPSFYKRLSFMSQLGDYILILFRDFPSVCTVINYRIKIHAETASEMNIQSVIRQLDAAECKTRFALITLSTNSDESGHVMPIIVDFENETIEAMDPGGDSINEFNVALDKFGTILQDNYNDQFGTSFRFVSTQDVCNRACVQRYELNFVERPFDPFVRDRFDTEVGGNCYLFTLVLFLARLSNPTMDTATVHQYLVEWIVQDMEKMLDLFREMYQVMKLGQVEVHKKTLSVVVHEMTLSVIVHKKTLSVAVHEKTLSVVVHEKTLSVVVYETVTICGSA